MKWTRKYGPLAAGCLSLLIVSLVLYFLLDRTRCSTGCLWTGWRAPSCSPGRNMSPRPGLTASCSTSTGTGSSPSCWGYWWSTACCGPGRCSSPASWPEQEDVRDIAERLRQALDSDGDASQVFPPQQQEIAAQVAEWKSKLQRREQALQQETARKNDLITYLAHDLKTPLTSVIGYLSLLDEVPDMPGKSTPTSPWRSPSGWRGSSTSFSTSPGITSSSSPWKRSRWM